MRRPRSVRVYLTALSLGIVLPLMIFIAFMVIRVAAREQEALTSSARYRTRIAAAAIDTELFSLRSRLLLLAGGLNTLPADLSEIQATAKRQFGDLTVILNNPGGIELFNTAIPFGTPLPNSPEPRVIDHVADTLQPLIGSLSKDPLTGRPAVWINVPVMVGAAKAKVLSLDIAPLLPQFLDQRDLPDGWVAAILDRQGRIIGRSHRPEQYLGQLARPAFIERIQAHDQGLSEGISREGVKVIAAFAHASLGGWTIVVSIPRHILMEPVTGLIEWLLLLGGFALLLAAGLAIGIGRRLTATVTGLVPVAEAVGHGEPAPPFASELVEANLVARSLHEASERLRSAEQERRALVGRTVIAQEEERKRIARELHDSLAQYLTALGLAVEKLPLDPETARRTSVAKELRRSIGALGGELNRLTWELRPVALEGLSMREAVTLYLEEWAERASMHVDVEVDLADRNLPRDIEATLFRVLQEAASNVLRHAGATRLSVVLETRDNEIRMLVEDDGVGFVPPEDGPDGVPTRRLGLIGMRERLALVRGSLEIESSPETGTTLYVRIPMTAEFAEP